MEKKTILIIDESNLFRDYIKSRLKQFNLEVETAINGLDGIAKLRNVLPDVLILDYHLSRKTCKEVLEEKARNPNTVGIPVILTAQKIDKSRLLELVSFNIKKVFMKPIKIDTLYQALSEMLGVRFEMDTTPCVIEAHVNDSILFIEIAQGMNREKIELLRFKIAELLELYNIEHPRVLIMISDMELSFVDGLNLEALLNTVLESSKAKTRHLKILTKSSFARDFVKGRGEYADVEIVDDLRKAMDGLLSDAGSADTAKEKSDVISERILAANHLESGQEAVEMRFEATEKKPLSLESMKETGKGLSIAVVDDDFIIQELIKTTFGAISADVKTYSDGKSFLEVMRAGNSFDLVFLDILMPGKNGYEVLDDLAASKIEVPVIILSALSQREAVLKAFQRGVKSYLIKPLKPEQILRKTLEILKANF
jgi:CheY-like chemotaxis protein